MLIDEQYLVWDCKFETCLFQKRVLSPLQCVVWSLEFRSVPILICSLVNQFAPVTGIGEWELRVGPTTFLGENFVKTVVYGRI